VTPRIDISDEMLRQSEAFGRAVVASYAAGAKARSKRMAMHDIDKDPRMQAVGRVGEVAAAIYLGLDPRADLDWGSVATDAGSDFSLPVGSVDVKATNHSRARRLIWPVNKRAIFEEACADILILAVVAPDLRSAELRGWLLREDFTKMRKTAGPADALMQGTWYVDQDHLMRLAVLRQWVHNASPHKQEGT
jgi:hypothetical protein